MVCFDSEGFRYYCRIGYACCPERACCSSGHNDMYQNSWFWIIWAMVIGFICCCSYAKQRHRQRGGNSMPFVFYNRQGRSGHESEEELLASTTTDGVFFVPPDGDQTSWAQQDWYKANKPPPYSLAAPEAVEGVLPPPISLPVAAPLSTVAARSSNPGEHVPVNSTPPSTNNSHVIQAGVVQPAQPNIAVLAVGTHSSDPPPEYKE